MIDFNKIKGLTNIIKEAEAAGESPILYKYVSGSKDPKMQALRDIIEKAEGKLSDDIRLYDYDGNNVILVYSKTGKSDVISAINKAVVEKTGEKVTDKDLKVIHGDERGMYVHEDAVKYYIDTLTPANYKTGIPSAIKVASAHVKNVESQNKHVDGAAMLDDVDDPDSTRGAATASNYIASTKAAMDSVKNLEELRKDVEKKIRNQELPESAKVELKDIDEFLKKARGALSTATSKINDTGAKMLEKSKTELDAVESEGELDDFMATAVTRSISSTRSKVAQLVEWIREKAEELNLPPDRFNLYDVRGHVLHNSFRPIINRIQAYYNKPISEFKDANDVYKQGQKLLMVLTAYSSGEFVMQSGNTKDFLLYLKVFVEETIQTKMAQISAAAGKEDAEEETEETTERGEALPEDLKQTGYYVLKTPADIKMGEPYIINPSDWMETDEFDDKKDLAKNGFLSTLSDAMDEFMYQPEPETMAAINSYTNTRKAARMFVDGVLGKIPGVSIASHELLGDPHQANPKLNELENKFRKRFGMSLIDTDESRKEQKERDEKKREAIKKKKSMEKMTGTMESKIDEDMGMAAQGGPGPTAPMPAGNFQNPGMMPTPNMDTFAKLGPEGTGRKKKKKKKKDENKYVGGFDEFDKKVHEMIGLTKPDGSLYDFEEYVRIREHNQRIEDNLIEWERVDEGIMNMLKSAIGGFLKKKLSGAGKLIGSWVGPAKFFKKYLNPKTYELTDKLEEQLTDENQKVVDVLTELRDEIQKGGGTGENNYIILGLEKMIKDQKELSESEYVKQMKDTGEMDQEVIQELERHFKKRAELLRQFIDARSDRLAMLRKKKIAKMPKWKREWFETELADRESLGKLFLLGVQIALENRWRKTDAAAESAENKQAFKEIRERREEISSRKREVAQNLKKRAELEKKNVAAGEKLRDYVGKNVMYPREEGRKMAKWKLEELDDGKREAVIERPAKGGEKETMRVPYLKLYKVQQDIAASKAEET